VLYWVIKTSTRSIGEIEATWVAVGTRKKKAIRVSDHSNNEEVIGSMPKGLRRDRLHAD